MNTLQARGIHAPFGRGGVNTICQVLIPDWVRSAFTRTEGDLLKNSLNRFRKRVIFTILIDDGLFIDVTRSRLHENGSLNFLKLLLPFAGENSMANLCRNSWNLYDMIKQQKPIETIKFYNLARSSLLCAICPLLIQITLKIISLRIYRSPTPALLICKLVKRE